MGEVITSLLEQWEYNRRWRGYQRCMMRNKRLQIEAEEAKRAARRTKRQQRARLVALLRHRAERLAQ